MSKNMVIRLNNARVNALETRIISVLRQQGLNADVNGVLNILRKSKVVSLEGLYSRGAVDAPVRIRVA